MRLTDIFTEDQSFDEDDQRDLDTLRMVLNKRCKDISKYYSNSNELGLIHSIRNTGKVKANYVPMQNKANRRPTDTPMAAHKFVDDKLEDMFGIKFRSNSLFTYPKPVSAAINDSAATLIFPYDGFTMASADDIRDLYIEVTRLTMTVLASNFGEKIAHLLTSYNPLPAWYQEDFFNDFDGFYVWLTSHVLDLPEDMVLSRDVVERTFNLTRDRVFTGIYAMVTEKYYLVDSGKDLVDAKRQEVMVHTDQFIAINLSFLKRALFANERAFTMSNIVDFLYGT